MEVKWLLCSQLLSEIQGNITVTGGAGKGSTKVNIAIPGLAADKAKKADKAKGKK